MNTYDPLDGIVYRHVPKPDDPSTAPPPSGRTDTRLPSGDANKAPLTRPPGAR